MTRNEKKADRTIEKRKEEEEEEEERYRERGREVRRRDTIRSGPERRDARMRSIRREWTRWCGFRETGTPRRV